MGSKGGRPTKYKDEYAKQAFKLCLLGFTDEKLATFFEVDIATINRWKHDHPAFCDSLHAGKDAADAEVAHSLYQRAVGYVAPDTKFATHEGVITDEKEYEKHYPPDYQAARLWLMSRQPGLFVDRQVTAIEGGDPEKPVKVEHSVDPDNVADTYNELIKRSQG